MKTYRQLLIVAESFKCSPCAWTSPAARRDLTLASPCSVVWRMSQLLNYYWGWLLLITSKINLPSQLSHFHISLLSGMCERAEAGHARSDSPGHHVSSHHTRHNWLRCCCTETGRWRRRCCVFPQICRPHRRAPTTLPNHCFSHSTPPLHTHTNTHACSFCKRHMQSGTEADLCTVDNEPLTLTLNSKIVIFRGCKLAHV